MKTRITFLSIITILFLNISLFAQSVWTWQNPLPQGNNLNTVKFYDINDGYAVGTFGTIIHLTNSGSTLTLKRGITNLNLFDVFYATKTTIYISGTEGSVFKTTDGGTTWNKLSINVTDEIKHLFFTDSIHGYAISANNVFKTNDGGINWTIQNLFPSILSSIYFIDGLNGFITADKGKIFKTSDAGKTWVSINTPATDNLNDISFADKVTGCIVGNNGVILRTTNAGQSWTSNPADTSKAAFTNIHFINSTNGFAASVLCFYSTTDGGKTWKKVSNRTYELNPYFLDNSTAYAVSYNGIIYKTTNGAVSWLIITGQNIFNINRIFFSDLNNGYAVGAGGNILSTANAGKTWTPVTSGNTNEFKSVYFPTVTTGYIAGANGTILKTVNSGKNWTKLTVPVNTNINSLFFVDSIKGLAAGEGNTMIITKNGGNTWSTVSGITNASINDVAYVSSVSCFAAGNNGMIFKSIDTGSTWSAVSSTVTTANLNSICSTNKNTIYIAGNGVILKSTDGGITFVKLSLSANASNYNFTSIKFTDLNIGFALVANQPFIYRTYDAGATWSEAPFITNLGKSLFFTDVNTGYVAGASGAILQTLNASDPCSTFIPYISAPKYKICYGETLTLTANAPGTANTTFKWNNNLTSASITVNPTSTTTYKITATYLTCSATFSLTISVNKKNTAKAIASDTLTFCNGDSVRLMAKNTGQGFYYLWLKDGILVKGSLADSVFNISTSGNYRHVLIDNMGCKDTSFVFRVNVYPHPVVDFGIKPDATGNGITFINTAIQSTNCFWDISDGFKSNEVAPYHLFPSSGYYNVCLTKINSISNCQSKACKNISVGSSSNSCLANFTFSVSGNTVAFTDSSVGNPTNWYWSFGDANTSSVKNPSHVYQYDGLYEVNLIIYNSATNCVSTVKKMVSIKSTDDDCNAKFEYYSDLATNKVYFNNSSLGKNLTHSLWNFGDNQISLQKNTVHKYSTAGFYNVCLTVWNESKKCYSTKCKYVKVGADTTKCHANFTKVIDVNKKTVTFIDMSIGNKNTYVWDFGDNSGKSTTRNTKYTYSGTGVYMVHLKIKTEEGCKANFFDLVNIDPTINKIKCRFVFSVNDTFKANSYPVSYKGTALGDPARVDWNFGDNSSDSTTTEPVHEYSSPGTYTVCMTVSDQTTQETDKSCQQITIASDGIKEVTTSSVSLSTYPNPAMNQLNIDFSVKYLSNTEINIFDIMGNRIASVLNQKMTSGIYTLQWNAEGLSSGIYFIQMTNGDERITNKIMISK
ncbi:MAG: PKD domain-containing protein [Bacteroidota bacterium]|nr:PKD domain-containing protein [Bacteroidota bacterium]